MEKGSGGKKEAGREGTARKSPERRVRVQRGAKRENEGVNPAQKAKRGGAAKKEANETKKAGQAENGGSGGKSRKRRKLEESRSSTVRNRRGGGTEIETAGTPKIRERRIAWGRCRRAGDAAEARGAEGKRRGKNPRKNDPPARGATQPSYSSTVKRELRKNEGGGEEELTRRRGPRGKEPRADGAWPKKRKRGTEGDGRQPKRQRSEEGGLGERRWPGESVRVGGQGHCVKGPQRRRPKSRGRCK